MANKKRNKPKKNVPKAMKRETRLKHGALWVHNYSGQHIVRDYRKKFKLDPSATLSDLHELGVLDDAKYAQMQDAEDKRLKALKGRKKSKEVDIWEHSDDRFFFIAGYTSGGAAYGVTWEEMGLEPYEMPKGIDCDTDEYDDADALI